MDVLQFLTYRRTAMMAIVVALLALGTSSLTAAAQDEGTVVPDDGETATSSLVIVNVACTNLEESSAEVLDYEGEPSGVLPNLDPECEFASGTYTIAPFGDDTADPITVETDASGTATIDLPVTDNQAPHVIVEDATGASTEFSITSGNTTEIDFFGSAVGDDTGDDTGEDDSAAAAATPDPASDASGVAELPSTGQGQADDNRAMQLWLLFGAAGLLATVAGAFTLHRRRS